MNGVLSPRPLLPWGRGGTGLGYLLAGAAAPRAAVRGAGVPS